MQKTPYYGQYCILTTRYAARENSNADRIISIAEWCYVRKSAVIDFTRRKVWTERSLHSYILIKVSSLPCIHAGLTYHF